MYVPSSTAFETFSSIRPGTLTSLREQGSDVNSTVCCPNSAYCVVNETTFETQCCDLGPKLRPYVPSGLVLFSPHVHDHGHGRQDRHHGNSSCLRRPTMYEYLVRMPSVRRRGLLSVR